MAGKKTGNGNKKVRVNFDADSTQVSKWKRRAKRAHKTLSQWARDVLDGAV